MNRPERTARIDKNKVYINHGEDLAGQRVQMVRTARDTLGKLFIGPAGTRTDSDGDGAYQEGAGGPHGSQAKTKYPYHRRKRITRTSARGTGKA